MPDEILVVDDAPTDDGPSWVASHHPDVRCVANPERKGFVHTANAGLRAADPASELVILLNQDTRRKRGGWRR
ncbi:MAG: glycosyltransferase [Ardenticatenales bacterium]|nr:glycosyltransferase [Ardenticatenales bacterium]